MASSTALIGIRSVQDAVTFLATDFQNFGGVNNSIMYWGVGGYGIQGRSPIANETPISIAANSPSNYFLRDSISTDSSNIMDFGTWSSQNPVWTTGSKPNSTTSITSQIAGLLSSGDVLATVQVARSVSSSPTRIEGGVYNGWNSGWSGTRYSGFSIQGLCYDSGSAPYSKFPDSSYVSGTWGVSMQRDSMWIGDTSRKRMLWEDQPNTDLTGIYYWIGNTLGGFFNQDSGNYSNGQGDVYYVPGSRLSSTFTVDNWSVAIPGGIGGAGGPGDIGGQTTVPFAGA